MQPEKKSAPSSEVPVLESVPAQQQLQQRRAVAQGREHNWFGCQVHKAGCWPRPAISAHSKQLKQWLQPCRPPCRQPKSLTRLLQRRKAKYTFVRRPTLQVAPESRPRRRGSRPRSAVVCKPQMSRRCCAPPKQQWQPCSPPYISLPVSCHTGCHTGAWQRRAVGCGAPDSP